jgi:allophanate hydrolase subunit 2
MSGSPRVVALAGVALFQDTGRRHLASGVPRSGAFDAFAHAAATCLVGRSPADASLEVSGTVGIGVERPLTFAVTGVATVAIDGRTVPTWTALHAAPGVVLDVHATGRAYLAVGGGFRPRPVLGSRSTCVLGPLGPAPVAHGDVLPVCADSTAPTVGDVVQRPPDTTLLRAVPGPHLPLEAGAATITQASRIGVRLRPDRPVVSHGLLPSIAVLPGTIQVLPSGEWVVLGPDAGTMGGYPVLGVVASADLRHLAHMGPGDRPTFQPIAPKDAPEPDLPQVLRLGDLPG